MSFRDDLLARFGDDEEEQRQTLSDLARHGAEGGFPGITYYSETTALYEEHEDEIWEALYEDAQEFGGSGPLKLIAGFGGADNVGSQAQFANLLVWYMAERVAHAEQP